jgi:hypothetical protein
VVFAGNGNDAALALQRQNFADHRSGLVERDIVVIWVVGNSVRSEFGQPPGSTAAQLRARFGMQKPGFRIFLVGKDGGIKLSQSRPLTVNRLFRTIDAMPMRVEEMRRPR